MSLQLHSCSAFVGLGLVRVWCGYKMAGNLPWMEKESSWQDILKKRSAQVMLLFQYINPDTGYSHFVNIDLLYEKKCLASLRLKFQSSPRNLQQWPTLLITRIEDAFFCCISHSIYWVGVCPMNKHILRRDCTSPNLHTWAFQTVQTAQLLRAEQVWGDVTTLLSVLLDASLFLPVCIYNEHHRLCRERHGADLISCADAPVCRQVCWVVITSA